MCESRHLESESESNCLESKSTRIRIHPDFLESESESNSFESESGFESDVTNVCISSDVSLHDRQWPFSRVVIGDQKFESKSTNFFLNPNPDSALHGLNPNPAQNGLNPDLNPNPDSHITGSNRPQQQSPLAPAVAPPPVSLFIAGPPVRQYIVTICYSRCALLINPF